ncbi:hypothetical protein [Paenibacillus mesotrionivorans]|uniref:Uncharacterized protein n=1 Tax=Paenibacillus mesotrionivorans TaxID=3160968 RepID=A0ACC7NSY5_9BACL
MSTNDPILLQILQAVQTLGEDMQTVKSDIKDLKGDVTNLKAGQAELFQLSSAIRNAQELTNAKLEGLTLDVRRAEGNLVRIEEKLGEEILDMRGEIRFLNHRIADVELTVDKLKEKRL